MTRPYKTSVGSISHGTLRHEDTFAAFADELERCDAYSDLIEEARAVLTLNRAGWSDLIDSDTSNELFDNLCDALNEHAPPYCYFGTLEGDGSDFGFWPSMDAIDELPRVSDPGEVESHAGEECVFVNDHGNVTVYGTDGAVLLELV